VRGGSTSISDVRQPGANISGSSAKGEGKKKGRRKRRRKKKEER